MFDAYVMRLVARPMSGAGKAAYRVGLSANTVTLIGFAAGLAASVSIVMGNLTAALVWLLLNRFCDGLDGAIARVTSPTDFGGFLDIVADFIFYGAYVFAFALTDPANALPAAFLIFSFMGTGSTFLAFAILAEKRRLTTDKRGRKSFYYLGGLTEGTETALVFAAMAIWPGAFPVLAWIFGSLCWLTTLSRIAEARTASPKN